MRFRRPQLEEYPLAAAKKAGARAPAPAHLAPRSHSSPLRLAPHPPATRCGVKKNFILFFRIVCYTEEKASAPLRAGGRPRGSPRAAAEAERGGSPGTAAHRGIKMNGVTNNNNNFSPSTEQITGLTQEQVHKRMEAGAYNRQPQQLTPSVGKILRQNICTLFNLINILLAIAILLVGHVENILFLGVAAGNTIMGIFQELRAKRTLDKLSILAQTKAHVLRDGKPASIGCEELVKDDVVLLRTGNQVCADAVVLQSQGLEMDEALLTGEPDAIRKEPGDKVMSGSFVVGGSAYVRVTSVGDDNYATALTKEAKRTKKSQSKLLKNLTIIIRILTFIIIPVGILLFYNQYSTNGETIQAAVLGASAAMLGMIPEGLVLLTGVTLTVSALNLARNHALVQSLSSIETLARVDVICLDKTGTITDGTLTFERLEKLADTPDGWAEQALAELMGALKDENATADILRKAFGSKNSWTARRVVPFSSARKWSGASFSGQGSFIIGAPEFVFANRSLPFFSRARSYAAKGMRVLCLAHSEQPMQSDALPPGLRCVALLILSDTIRDKAVDTFRYFREQGVTLKVISGDNPATVSAIAAAAGLEGWENAIDMSSLPPDADLHAIAEENTVFGRVSPQQKKELIRALNENGHTTCMTGDGVNDVPAMKQANCSVAMVEGSDAARCASDFVLMTSDFSAMVQVLREGRRVINNIENVAALYLVKTIYSTILSIIYSFMPLAYPFTPLQMTPINVFTVGIPSFLLALRPNFGRTKGRFLANILENSLPAAVTVILNILIVELAGYAFELDPLETSTMHIFLTAAVGFILLFRISRPLTGKMIVLDLALIAGFLAFFIFGGPYFNLGNIFNRTAFFYLPLLVASIYVFNVLSAGMNYLQRLFGRLREQRVKKHA